MGYRRKCLECGHLSEPAEGAACPACSAEESFRSFCLGRDAECRFDCGDTCLNPPARKIDINVATVFELTTVPGLGVNLARLIVERREATGGFANLEELLGIGGIWPALLERFSGHVTIGTPPRPRVPPPPVLPLPPPPQKNSTRALPAPVPPMRGAPAPLLPSSPLTPTAPQAKSKTTAVLLAIMCCGLGLHNFYLGYYGRAIAQLITLFLGGGAIVAVWVVIEVLMIVGGRIKDANGNELRA